MSESCSEQWDLDPDPWLKCSENEGLRSLECWSGRYWYESLELRVITIPYGSLVSGMLRFGGGKGLRSNLPKPQS